MSLETVNLCMNFPYHSCSFQKGSDVSLTIFVCFCWLFHSTVTEGWSFSWYPTKLSNFRPRITVTIIFTASDSAYSVPYSTISSSISYDIHIPRFPVCLYSGPGGRNTISPSATKWSLPLPWKNRQISLPIMSRSYLKGRLSSHNPRLLEMLSDLSVIYDQRSLCYLHWDQLRDIHSLNRFASQYSAMCYTEPIRNLCHEERYDATW